MAVADVYQLSLINFALGTHVVHLRLLAMTPVTFSTTTATYFYFQIKVRENFGHAGRLYVRLYNAHITADTTFCQVNIKTARCLLRAFDSHFNEMHHIITLALLFNPSKMNCITQYWLLMLVSFKSSLSQAGFTA